jgi:hypothetical protein
MVITEWIALPLAATEWAAAISGIVGVLIGGAITTGATIWVQRHADRKEKRVEARQLGATISLVHSNLQEVLASLQVLERDGVWRAPLTEHWLTVWQDRAPVLAGAIGRDEFETLAEAFLVARLLVWQASDDGQGFSGEDRQIVAKWMDKVQEARATLERPIPS